MVRKLLVYVPYYPPHVGGLENFAFELHEALAQNYDWDITVFTDFPTVEVVPNWPLPQFWRPRFWRMWQHVWREKPDVIVSHTRFFATSLMAWWHHRLTGVPWVHIEHGSSFVHVTSPVTNALAKLYDLTFGRLVLSSATKIVCISQAVATFAQRLAPRSGAPTVIYRGLKTAQIDSTPPMLLSELRRGDARKVVIVTAARLYHWKGLEYAITAIKQLPPAIQEQIAYYIIGDGEDMARLQSQAASAPDGLITFLGQQSHAETIGWLKAAEIYIHASLPGGGLATSLLEAMYCQCAIIATPNEGAAEVIVDHVSGLIVPAADTSTLSTAIEHLSASAQQRQRLATQAKQTVLQQFSWTSSAQQFDQLFQTLGSKNKV